MSKTTQTSIDRILRGPEVEGITGLSRDSLYRLARQDKFPKPVEIGPRASGWRESEVKAWVETRPRATRGVRGQRIKAQPAMGQVE